MKKPRVSEGDLVVVDWLDAEFFEDPEGQADELKTAIEYGGAPLQVVGWVVESNDKVLVLCGDRERPKGKPHRDFNVIPLGMITKVKKVDE